MSVDTGSSIPPAIAALVHEGRRLDADQVRTLAGVRDILALGALADDVRRRRHGAETTFVRVHALTLEGQAGWPSTPEAAREVRLSGTGATADAWLAAVAAARALASGRVLRGGDLADLWRLGGASLLGALAGAGLDEVATVSPGPGSAEAVAAARAAGLAVRVMGLGAPVDDRAAWLLDARALVDAAGGFDAVAPLPRETDVTTPTTGFDDVRSIALARLVFDTVPHIQVDWQRHGPKLAQVALTMGADDLDLVSAIDDATLGLRRAPMEEVRRNIAAAGGVAVERDGRFGRVTA